MYLKEILLPEFIIPSLNVDDKSQALINISEKAGEVSGLDHELIAKAIIAREEICSTAIGNGTAIPHECFKGLDKIYCVFAKLDQAIDFDSMDDSLVDLVFLLLFPDNNSTARLKTLACIARFLSDNIKVSLLRKAKDISDIYGVLTNEELVVTA